MDSLCQLYECIFRQWLEGPQNYKAQNTMLLEQECNHSDLKLLQRKSRYYIPNRLFKYYKIKNLLGKQKWSLSELQQTIQTCTVQYCSYQSHVGSWNMVIASKELNVWFYLILIHLNLHVILTDFKLHLT